MAPTPREFCRVCGRKRTPRNVIIMGPHHYCRPCYRRRQKKRMKVYLGISRKPSTSGLCMKRLHKWIPENWYVTASGDVLCWPCKRAYEQTRRPLVRIPCLASPCGYHTNRTTDDRTYICPKHRKNPPSWIATLGRRIVGTEVLAA